MDRVCAVCIAIQDKLLVHNITNIHYCISRWDRTAGPPEQPSRTPSSLWTTLLKSLIPSSNLSWKMHSDWWCRRFSQSTQTKCLDIYTARNPSPVPFTAHQAPCQRRYFILLQTSSVVKQIQREEEIYGYTQARLSTFRATNAIVPSQTPSASQGAARREVSMTVSSVCDLRVQSDVFGVRVLIVSASRNRYLISSLKSGCLTVHVSVCCSDACAARPCRMDLSASSCLSVCT